MPTSHAILAPSASKRWMACAPSARAEESCPSQDTAYTREGTIAHSCAEHLLHYYLSLGASGTVPFDNISRSFMTLEPWVSLENDCHSLGVDFWELAETVHDCYVVPVYEDFLMAKAYDPDAVLLIEAELNLASFIPEGFGSSDAVIISGTTCRVYDLKYGKGLKVEAEENPQMMCYALGALYGPAETYHIENVMMTIIQPRLQHYSTYSLTYDELVDWGINVLRPRAEKAFRGEGEYNPGDHCKFCRFAPRCRACAQRATVTADANSQPEALTDQELGDILKQLDSIKTWAANVEAYALAQIQNGKRIPGWKLVEGRSMRKITDQNAAIKALVDAGLELEYITKPVELKTLTELKKYLKGSTFDSLLGPYIVKPQGKPTLAPETDERPALADAKKDFENIII